MDDLWGYLVTFLIVMGGVLHFSVKRGVQTWFDSRLAALSTELQKEINRK